MKTSLPQNDTNTNAYTLNNLTDGGSNDYSIPQIQANGTKLVLAQECKSGAGSSTVDLGTNTLVQVSMIANSGAAIASFTGTSGTLTFTTTTTNPFVSGQGLKLTGFTGGNTGLNAQSVTVLSAGLTTTTFEAAVTGSGYASGTGAATATHTMRVYNSSGTELTGSPSTCASVATATNFSHLDFGIDGAETESSGSVISEDNLIISYTGAALSPTAN